MRNKEMTKQQKHNALLAVQTQLLEFASVQPSYHFKLHGSKDINESIQLCKRLVSLVADDLLKEEAEELDIYLNSSVDSISLHNLN